jgi:hypothetical protein
MGKITKKYVGQDQVGSVQIELENESALRAKSSDGISTVELLEFDDENKFKMLQHPYLPADASEALQAVTKQQLDAAIEGVESEVGGDLSALEQRVEDAEGAISTLQGDFSALDGRVGNLETSMTAAQEDIIALQDGKVSKSGDTMTGDLFFDIDNLGVATGRVGPSAFTSRYEEDNFLDIIEIFPNQISLRQEEPNNTNTGSVELGSIFIQYEQGVLISSKDMQDTAQFKLQKSETKLASYGLSSIMVKDGDKSLEYSAASGQLSLKDGEDAVLPVQPYDVATKAYVDAQITENTVFHKQAITLTAQDIANQYVDLSVEAIPFSCQVGVGERVMLWEGLDYAETIEGGVTRISFTGPSAANGSEELVEGQTLYIQCVIQ